MDFCPYAKLSHEEIINGSRQDQINLFRIYIETNFYCSINPERYTSDFITCDCCRHNFIIATQGYHKWSDYFACLVNQYNRVHIYHSKYIKLGYVDESLADSTRYYRT